MGGELKVIYIKLKMTMDMTESTNIVQEVLQDVCTYINKKRCSPFFMCLVHNTRLLIIILSVSYIAIYGAYERLLST